MAMSVMSVESYNEVAPESRQSSAQLTQRTQPRPEPTQDEPELRSNSKTHLQIYVDLLLKYQLCAENVWIVSKRIIFSVFAVVWWPSRFHVVTCCCAPAVSGQYVDAEDGHGEEQESVSIDAMDVSDFDAEADDEDGGDTHQNDNYGADQQGALRTPPPRPPPQPHPRHQSPAPHQHQAAPQHHHPPPTQNQQYSQVSTNSTHG